MGEGGVKDWEEERMAKMQEIWMSNGKNASSAPHLPLAQSQTDPPPLLLQELPSDCIHPTENWSLHHLHSVGQGHPPPQPDHLPPDDTDFLQLPSHGLI